MGGSGLRILQFVITALLVVLAWSVARRQRAHAGVAVFVSWMFFVDLLRLELVQLRGVGAHPLHGLARFAFHADQLMVTSWSFAFLACCAGYFLRQRKLAFGVALAWLVVWLAMVASYPRLVLSRLMVAYQLLFWVALAISWTMILFAVFVRRELRPGLSHLVLILYATADLVVGAFPFLQSFIGNWGDVRLITALCAFVCIVFHVHELTRPAMNGALAREGS